MNLVADEGVDAPTVVALRAAGHRVAYVAEMSPGITDDDVLALANRGGSVLLTADRDFGELVFRLGRVSGGVALLRLPGLSPATRARVVAAAVAAHGGEMQDAFTVISAGMVRVRHRGWDASPETRGRNG